jgi:hypothetical protein
MLGIEVSQDQTTQTPRIKLGYNRAEVALVPSNRDDLEKPGSRIADAVGKLTNCQETAECKKALSKIKDGGAADTAEVIMEIRMQGGILFNGLHDGGMYQRLAVGRTAVKQPGASLMFARDDGGKIGADASTAVGKATKAVKSIAEPDWDAEEVKGRLRAAFEKETDAGVKAKFEKAAAAAGYPASGHADCPAFRNFVADEKADPKKAGLIENSLKAQGVKF